MTRQDHHGFPTDRPRLGALTWMRFLGAVWVLLYHGEAMGAFAAAPRWLRGPASRGYVAVTFFFVLSGFVLVYTYAGRRLDLGRFWRLRLARLYPVYLLSLLLTAGSFIRVAHDPPPGSEWIAQHMGLTAGLVLAMQQAWVSPAAMAWNGVCWAVSVEVFFYAVFPLLLGAFSRMSPPRLAAVAAGAWLAAMSCSALYAVTAPDGVAVTARAMRPDGLFWLQIVKFNPVLRLPEFIAGMALGIVFLRREPAGRPRWIVPAGALVLLGTLVAAPWIPYPVMHTSLCTPAFGLLVFGLALRPTWSRVFDGRPWQLLGESSYSLFLLHPFILGRAFFVGRSPGELAGPPDHAAARMALGGALAVVVGLLAFRWYEEPLRKRLAR